MEPLYYSRGRLAAAATFFLVVGGFFVWLWMDPSWAAASRRFGRLLASDFGRYVLIPSCAAVCLAVSGLTASLVLGNGKALESSGTHLIVSTVWGRKRIALSELRSFGIERSGRYPQLVLEGDGIGILGGSTLRIALGTVQDGESRIPSLLDTLAALRAEALRPRLDRASAAPAASAPPLPLPQRAAFGRKGS
ncbi:MAG TPA: hypothetical protein VGB57_00755 [Allosphingosinicella sp.]|jgi:hypothetical protein